MYTRSFVQFNTQHDHDMIPRQAQDKHREDSKSDALSAGGNVTMAQVRTRSFFAMPFGTKDDDHFTTTGSGQA
jgi:hypothetical protein